MNTLTGGTIKLHRSGNQDMFCFNQFLSREVQEETALKDSNYNLLCYSDRILPLVMLHYVK